MAVLWAICGETRLKGWDVCPACGHPYKDEDEETDDLDDDEDDEDDEDDDK